MFRILTRIFLALVALFAMRMIFAAARRMHRVDGGDGDGSRNDRAVGGKPGAGRVAGPGRPRIDRATAEDVPYVEVKPESARRG